MEARTLTVSVDAPADDVFAALADIENFPSWAAGFCERLDLVRGRWRGLTSEGEQFIELEAFDRARAIDVRWGEADQPTGHLPLRVHALPGGATVVSVLLHRGAGQGDGSFAEHCLAFGAALADWAVHFAARRRAGERLAG